MAVVLMEHGADEFVELCRPDHDKPGTIGTGSVLMHQLCPVKAKVLHVVNADDGNDDRAPDSCRLGGSTEPVHRPAVPLGGFISLKRRGLRAVTDHLHPSQRFVEPVAGVPLDAFRAGDFPDVLPGVAGRLHDGAPECSRGSHDCEDNAH